MTQEEYDYIEKINSISSDILNLADHQNNAENKEEFNTDTKAIESKEEELKTPMILLQRLIERRGYLLKQEQERAIREKYLGKYVCDRDGAWRIDKIDEIRHRDRYDYLVGCRAYGYRKLLSRITMKVEIGSFKEDFATEFIKVISKEEFEERLANVEKVYINHEQLKITDKL